MVNMNDMMNKVAAQVGTDENTLNNKMQAVLATEGPAWASAGKTDEQVQTLALRVAARQIAAEKAKMARSGATLFEGMFVHVPRYKDWADMAYKKMKNTLASLDASGRLALVGQGALYLYEDNHDGTFTRHGNTSLLGRQSFSEGYDSVDVNALPDRVMALDANTHFSLVWDKNNMTFANGNENFKYGAARPLTEKDRTCLFLGRPQGANADASLLEVRFSGAEAEAILPTFTTGTIGLKVANKPGLCYGVRGTSFNEDPAVASIFAGPPLTVTDGAPSGPVFDWLGNTFMPSLKECAAHYATLDGKERWDTIYGTIVEVAHIDPRDNGGFTVVVGDLDLLSPHPTVDIYVPAEHESSIDFGVGSEMVIIGQPWSTREGEPRFSVNGWWCMDGIAPVEATPVADEGEADGWDA